MVCQRSNLLVVRLTIVRRRARLLFIFLCLLPLRDRIDVDRLSFFKTLCLLFLEASYFHKLSVLLHSLRSLLCLALLAPLAHEDQDCDEVDSEDRYGHPDEALAEIVPCPGIENEVLRVAE